MKTYNIYRTYLVRFRAPVEADNREEAIGEHRAMFENTVETCGEEEIEVVSIDDEKRQLGDKMHEVADLDVE